MKYIFAFLLAALFALPNFAQTSVDNCCQLGRACSTEEEWDQGWYDFANGLCPADAAAGTVSHPPMESFSNNCCHFGRTCTTEEEWDQGYYEWANTHCASVLGYEISMPAPVELGAYTFVGTGKGTSYNVLLSPGTWNIRAVLTRRADIYIVQADEEGQQHLDGKCLSYPQWWHWYDYSTSILSDASAQFIVRTHCLVRFAFYHNTGFNAEQESYKVFVRKVSDNF